MNEKDKKEIVELMMTTLNATRDDQTRIDSLTHKEDHDWIAEEREQQKLWRDRKEHLWRRVAGAGVLVVLGTILTAVAVYFFPDKFGN